jgi:protocatechuate 3,4-dioxygenase alpha subunit
LSNPPFAPSRTVGPYLAISLHRLIPPEIVDPSDPRAVRLRGTLLDGAGDPVPDGLIEIWAANPAGRYAHPADDRTELALEDGFLGFGRCGTVLSGTFEFVTVKPGRVPWPEGGLQAPHLEVCVSARGMLKHAVTRIYFPDEEEAIAVLLAEPTQDHREIVTITSPEAVSLTELAALATDVTGDPYAYEPLAREDWIAHRRALGRPNWAIEAGITYYDGVALGEADVVSDDYEALTGHPAASIRELVELFRDDLPLTRKELA